MRIDNITTVGGDDTNFKSTVNTITATTSNPAKGVAIQDFIRSRRIGNNEYEVDMVYSQGSGGSQGSGAYLFVLPNGLQFNSSFNTGSVDVDAINTSAETSAMLRGGSGVAVSSGAATPIYAVRYDDTRFKLVTSGGTAIINSGVYSLGNSNIGFAVRFSFTSG